MKSYAVLAAAAVLPGVLAQADCLSNCLTSVDWNRRDRDTREFCGDEGFITDLTECIGESTCSEEDKSTFYETLAQACANSGYPLTESEYASYSATSGGAYPTEAWSSIADSWESAWETRTGPAYPGVTAWGGVWGPFAGGWGPFSKEGDWVSGHCTGWWNGTACPTPAWTGWTEGEWRSKADWTTWKSCSATTTATSVYTTTDGSATITSTSYGVKVAAAEATDSDDVSAQATASATDVPGAAAGRTQAAGGLVVAALGVIALL